MDPNHRKVSIVEVERNDKMSESIANPQIAHLTSEATGKEATQTEKNMSLIQAIRLYPKAAGWSILLSTAIVMEGYDTALLGNFYAFPPFTKRYGVLQPGSNPPTYQITPAWQNGLSNGAQVGEILGLYGAGIVVDKIGYRKTMLISLFSMICFIFIPFFAQNLQTLLVGEILQGTTSIPWGVFQTICRKYPSGVVTVLPLHAGGGAVTTSYNRPMGLSFAIQWMWPLPIFIGCIFAPELPWWYVRKGRIEKAKRSLIRLTTAKADPNFNADETIAMMIHTNEFEKQIQDGTGYSDCFRGVDARHTEIVSITWVIQAFCGSAFMTFSTYFYENAGLADANAFDLNMAQYALGAIGTIGSWFVMVHLHQENMEKT